MPRTASQNLIKYSLGKPKYHICLNSEIVRAWTRLLQEHKLQKPRSSCKQIVRPRKSGHLDREITGLPIHPQAAHLFHQRRPVQVEESGGASLHPVRKGEGVADHFQLDIGEDLYQINAPQ